MPRISPCAQGEADVAVGAAQAEALDLEHDGGVGRQVADHAGGVDLASGHVGGDALPVEARGGAGDDVGPGAEDGEALGDREDLVELVGDEHERDAAPAQGLHEREQAGHLVVGQRRRGLVHDDDPGLVHQRPADRGQLLVRDGEPLDVGVEVQREPELADDRLGGRARAARGVEAAPVRHGGGEDDVLGHGEVGEEGEVLVDDLDAALDGGDRVHRPVGDAVDDDLAGVRLLGPRDDLDEGRLAAAVLPGQAVHLAREEVERDALERGDAAVGLADVTDLEHGHGGARGPGCHGGPGGSVVARCGHGSLLGLTSGAGPWWAAPDGGRAGGAVGQKSNSAAWSASASTAASPA